MTINENSQMNLHHTGVYQIKNKVNEKVYIGSTTQSFELRLKQHVRELKKGVHKNTHLQSSWDKHKENNFEFSILKICTKDMCLIQEQLLMNKFEVTMKTKGYNINPLASGTPNLSKETVKKRAVTFSKTNKEAMVFYKKVKSQKIALEDVPKKYVKLVLAKLNNVPWNKGLTKDTADFSFLKGIKKTITEKHKKGRLNFSETMKNKSKKILVYDYTGKLIKTFRCISDIVDYTKQSHDLPLILRTTGRKGTTLSSQNISNVCNAKAKHHKGLIFRFEGSDLPVIALQPTDIHRHWKEFKPQCAASKSDLG
jgi:group I intron endonuclease